jgi:hypothetical protein
MNIQPQLEFSTAASDEAVLQRLPQVSSLELTLREEVALRLIMSPLRKSLSVTSKIGRKLDLTKAVTSTSGLAEVADKAGVYQGEDLICVLRGQGTIELFAEAVEPLKKFVQRLYEHLTDDVMIEINKSGSSGLPSSNNSEPRKKKAFLLKELQILAKSSESEVNSRLLAKAELESDTIFLNQ